MPQLETSKISLIPFFRTARGFALGTILLFVLIPALSYLTWKILPERELELVVVNKTVPTENFWEHQSFFWMLNHLKLVHGRGDYELEKDYFGYKPGGEGPEKYDDFKGLSPRQIDSIGNKLDFLYLIDTYGIYERDLDPTATTNKKLYGGLIKEDFQLIQSTLEKEKTLIVEFNTIASPTSKSLRTEFENLLGVQWSGWIARYFDELDILLNTDIPDWILENYIKQHGSWDFKGRGVIFIGENGKIEVLGYPELISNKVPIILSPLQSQHSFSLPSRVAYPHWIEINRISREYEVISYYDLEPTEAGLIKLKEMGLPKYFPATVRRKNGEGYIYYFAGDFAGHSRIEPSHLYFGLPWLWKFFYGPEDYSRRDSFFWQYYYPMMKNILLNQNG